LPSSGVACTTTFFTFVGAAGRACRFVFAATPVVRAGFSAARCDWPPAQPATRTGTRIQLAARSVTDGYPVNFGCAFVGVAAGALPLPESPLVSVVDVVSVAVVSVVALVSVELELESVEDVDDEESGVVVVIVVTTVLPPVVTVETIVVVACVAKGAAPAVNAAVAAPSVTSTAKAAPQPRYFL
jgi:hypothetical protein